MPTKICQECKEQKDILSFKHDFRASDGYAKVCLECRARKLGLTQTEYEYRLLTNGIGISKADHGRSEYIKEWHAQHPGKKSSYTKRYNQRNPEKIKEHNHRRKAWKSSTTDLIFTEKDRVDLIAEFDGCCAYCGVKPDKLEMDHIVPLSRGGQHTKSNIVPACFNCNRSKGARTPEQAGMEIKHG